MEMMVIYSKLDTFEDVLERRLLNKLFSHR